MYCVYIHTNKTNGKMYIGVTIHEDNPNKRWAGGKNYIRNTHFYNAIKKYVWDGFTHEIFAKNLSKEDAMAIEMLLIEYFQTTNQNMGYNKTSGGDVGTKLSKESILKQSQSLKKFYSEHPEAHPNRKLANNRSKMSYPEKIVYDWLTEKNISFEHNKLIRTKTITRYVDFYLKANNLIIEVDGEFWHNRKIEKDKKKDFEAEEAGYTTLRIKAKERIIDRLNDFFGYHTNLLV
jgi:very-short-patch-repair endonuclease